MRRYTKWGYQHLGQFYCERCAPAEAHQLYPEGKWDFPIHCAVCNEFLENDLTKRGRELFAERLRHYEFELWPPGQLEAYREGLGNVEWFVTPTFEGWMDPTTGHLGQYRLRVPLRW